MPSGGAPSLQRGSERSSCRSCCAMQSSLCSPRTSRVARRSSASTRRSSSPWKTTRASRSSRPCPALARHGAHLHRTPRRHRALRLGRQAAKLPRPGSSRVQLRGEAAARPHHQDRQSQDAVAPGRVRMGHPAQTQSKDRGPRKLAMRIAARRGKRIAAVALARKLAGILFAMTRHARDFEPDMLKPVSPAQAA